MCRTRIGASPGVLSIAAARRALGRDNEVVAIELDQLVALNLGLREKLPHVLLRVQVERAARSPESHAPHGYAPLPTLGEAHDHRAERKFPHPDDEGQRVLDVV